MRPHEILTGKLILALGLFAAAAALQAETLTVVATGLKNDRGVVQFSLYNKKGSIPDKALNRYYKMKRVPIVGRKAKAVFRNLPKGRYAVSLFHDENDNRRIDKGLMLPKEGVGLSNFDTIDLFHLPDFERASFLLNKNRTITLKTIYL